MSRTQETFSSCRISVRVAVRMLWCAAATSIPFGGHTQDYPSKPIRVITAEAGGGSDFAARLVTQELTAYLGQQLIVDNRGGSTTIPGELLTKARPDGYTLLVYGSTIWLAPLLQAKAAYNPMREFSPISSVAVSPYIMALPASVTASTVSELIALAKLMPGKLNYAGALPGSLTHLGAELFNAMAGVKIIGVHYKGTGPAITALLAGEVQLLISPAGAVMPHIKSGRVKALAITSIRPSVLLPGLPTVASSGLPGYETEIMHASFAPAGTPSSLINRLNRELLRALTRTEIRDKFFSAGVEARGSSPQELEKTMASEIGKWSKIIGDAGIRID